MAINSEKYLGLNKKQAQNLAEKDGVIFRLISIDGKPFFSYPEDTRDDRVCIELENDKVTKATIN